MTATTLIALSTLAGAFAGLAALLAALWLQRGRAAAPRPIVMGPLSEPRRFLFRDGYLVEHSGNVGFLLADPIDHLRAWDALIDVLGVMIDGVPDAFADLHEAGRAFRLEGRIGRDRLHVSGAREGDALRISVASAEAGDATMRIGVESLRALEDEMDLVTRSADTSPAASWVVDGEGRVIWANEAYQDVAARCAGDDARRGWPLVTLFPESTAGMQGRGRRRVVDVQGRGLWFDVAAGPADADGNRHMHALPLDAVVAAEDSQRTFIQTLSKTFAYLPTGLAIFDAERTLAMFNPALMDMTGLDGAWLSRRPTLEDFFDALRERRRLPEPRDYKTWRDGLSDLTRVDAGGTYRETWTLPTGQTYCVTGRPQADGAVALMLEDISAEISADQAHREELATLTGALDACDDAIVVFAADGRRLAANGAAALRLAPAPGQPLPATLEEAIRAWRRDFLPSGVWADLRAAARGDAPAPMAEDWVEMLRRDGARNIPLRVRPARGGGVTLAFGFEPAPVSRRERAPQAVAIPAE